jgi:uncharacterized coiled-coil DUF342 family protein
MTSEMQKEIDFLKNEVEIRQEMIKHQNEEIIRLQQKILELEDDKKALIDVVKSEIQPLIHEGKSKRKES